MAKSQRRRDFEKENGVPTPLKPNHAIVTESTDDGLFGMVDLNTPSPVVARDIESPIAEPYIGIEGTRISTRGGNLASTALANIMETFNAASKKEKGLDKSIKGVPDHRFYTYLGGPKASRPYIAAGFMDGKAIGATLEDDDKFPNREPPHKRDIEILNGSYVKLTEVRPEELIAFEEAELKKWLVENYGSGAKQIIENSYSNDEHKVTSRDRKKLVKKVRDLEDDAKKIASGEMLPYGSISSDEEPLSDEDLDISRQGESEEN